MNSDRHPLQDEFDAADSVQWHQLDSSELGFASNGLVAWRNIDEPEGDTLIFYPREWEAFTGGVRDGEFDSMLESDAPERE